MLVLSVGIKNPKPGTASKLDLSQLSKKIGRLKDLSYKMFLPQDILITEIHSGFLLLLVVCIAQQSYRLSAQFTEGQ